MKCSCCSKKVPGLLMVTCAGCAAAFCLTCRHPESHACPSPVKQVVTLPKVVAPKVEKL
jgi:hypothetical protein